MDTATTLTIDNLEAALAELAQSPSPRDAGRIELIVRRPAQGQREVLDEAAFDPDEGLVGDNWRTRGSRQTEDGSAHPGAQITLMNSRVIQAIAGTRELWPLAGDQLYVDLDLSADNLPAGTRIAVGTAVLEISDVPHNGCGKFTEHYGSAATRLVNSKEGRAARRRGVNARVVQAGIARPGDLVRKLASTDNLT